MRRFKPFLEIVDGPRPIVFQQARERAIRKQASAGLAGRAVVALVLGIDNPLHRRAAHGTRLLEAAMHGHLVVKRADLLGKPAAALLAQPSRPLSERRARR